jgi:hypothetical protein
MSTRDELPQSPEHLKASYDDSGWTVFPRLISEDDLELLRDLVDSKASSLGITDVWGESAAEAFDGGAWKSLRRDVSYDPVFVNFIESPRLKSSAELLLGVKPKSFGIQKLRINIPGQDVGVSPWHQDEWTWPDLRGANPVVFWVPLVPVDESNGLGIATNFRERRMLEHNRDDYKAGVVDTSVVTASACPALEPGDSIAFNSFVIHRTVPNTSSRLRLSVDFRFVADTQ